MKLVLSSFVLLACMSASAGEISYSGVPQVRFLKLLRGQESQKAEIVAACTAQLASEAAKIVRAGGIILDETPCRVVSATEAPEENVSGTIQFIK